MRQIILFGGIHDGLELELPEDKKTLVLYDLHSLSAEDLFPIGEGPTEPIEEGKVTYSFTYMKNKEGRWIFQII